MKGSDFQRVAEAIRFVDAHAAEQPRLAEIAGRLGLSEFHFHRLFRRWAGVTPKDFLQALTLAQAKRLLADSTSLLETSLTLGLSGTGRLHDLFLGLEAMTPGEFKTGGAGLTIGWKILPTPFGEALFAATDKGLCALAFVDGAEAAAPAAFLRDRWPEARLRENRALVAPYAREAAARMRGAAARRLSLAPRGTAFQVKVRQALLAIPEGRVATYRDLAAAIGQPGAVRAVGTACAANPIAYLIPCHRVIRATGAVGDYRWGAERKTALLAVEGARRLATPHSRA
jgi:AraC family transcriptional regulator of adaptative response/methylated-DNA-[protein]-cysteine methyltransferase